MLKNVAKTFLFIVEVQYLWLKESKGGHVFQKLDLTYESNKQSAPI